MYESPRIRRLKSDLAALERLRAESSVFLFKTLGSSPPQQYTLAFRGMGLTRDRGKVVARDYHEVEIRLGSQYPRTMPELRWLTPIYHPNISEIGMVCLGAYGTHWVPSLALDELCVMLWDMARYQNYDIRSPYNREAALWAANQSTFRFPMDTRPIRDLREHLGRVESQSASTPELNAVEPDSAPSTSYKSSFSTSDGESITILDLELDLRQYELRKHPSPRQSQPPPRRVQNDEVMFID